MRTSFLLRDGMRKHGVCCRPVSVRPSVTFVYSIQAEDIVELLTPSSSRIILVFDSEHWYPTPR